MDKNYQKALEGLTRLCSQKEKSSGEVKAKINSLNLTQKQKEEIIAYLIENNYVNDHRYAAAFVRHHFRLKSWGKKKISYALKQKKIPESIIQQALEEISDEEYLNTLVHELKKKKAQIHAKNRFDLLARLQRFALSRGYETDIIHKALNDVA